MRHRNGRHLELRLDTHQTACWTAQVKADSEGAGARSYNYRVVIAG
jgi:hypothetical protein